MEQKLTGDLSKNITKLYKYMSIEYIEDAVNYGVYASKLNEVNDIYEGEAIEYIDNYRIACLTNSPKAMLMWAYYGNHRQCCVEFDVPTEAKTYISKVEYVKEFIDRSGMDSNGIKSALMIKQDEWEHENEYRAVYDANIDFNNRIWRILDDKRLFLSLPVRSIRFGVLAEKNEKYLEKLRYLKEYIEDGGQIKVTKMRKAQDKYALEESKQFDIKSEIKKYS